jgi:hypothetical protein
MRGPSIDVGKFLGCLFALGVLAGVVATGTCLLLMWLAQRLAG